MQIAKEYQQLSYAGMRDSLDPTTADPRKAFLLQNVYPADTFLGAAVIGRPGFTQLGAQLGQVGFRNVQRCYQFTKLDGTQYTIAFCGGLMYTLNWGTNTWTNVPLGGGAALDKSATVYCVTFNNKVVVSDGVNLPWTWDGTTFAVLTNAAIAFGPIAVYYAKLFLITASNRLQFIWSEENQENTGYVTGGYNDAWVFGQTKQDALWLLFATNERLYVFRSRSITAVSGQVNPDFASAGTREAVSETIGTNSPNAAVYYEDRIYFLDAQGRPYVIDVAGGSFSPLWADLRETLAVVPRTFLPQALGASSPQMQMAFHALRTSVQDPAIETIITVDTRTNLIAGLWTGFVMTALDSVLDGSLVPFLVHGSSNGFVYQHGNPDGSVWDDEANVLDGGTVPILHVVTGTPLGFSVTTDKLFDRVDFSFRLLTNLSNVSVDYETPRAQGQAQAFSLVSNSSLWDQAKWDQAFWSAVNIERHQAIGTAGQGRWIRPRVIHQFAQERFGLCGTHVTGYDIGALPGIP